MEYRQLGRTGLRVSTIGLGSGGTSQLGQTYGHSRDDVARLVRNALDLGINHIDTAAAYGDSEERLGYALAGVPRDSFVLATKAWPERNDAYMTPDEVRASLSRSLERLRLDYVDLFYLHGVNPAAYRRCVELYGPLLEELRASGRARYFGISEAYQTDHAHETARMLAADSLFDVVMIGYNLVTPGAALTAFPALQAANIGVVVMCAVRAVINNPSLLTKMLDRWKSEGHLAPEAVSSESPLDWLLSDACPTITDAAYKFAADHPAVSCVLTGTANQAHLEANVRAALSGRLPAEAVRRLIDTFGPVGRNITAADRS